MKKLTLTVLLLLTSVVLSYGSGENSGKVYDVDHGSGEVRVSINRGTIHKTGELLQVRTGDGPIILEVAFPMFTISKCRIKGKGELSQLSRGMIVYRYSKDDGGTAVRPGEARVSGGIEFCFIPGGTFIMGAPESERKDDNKKVSHEKKENIEKQHEVTLSSFWMGRYEVTQKQYSEIVGKNPSDFQGDNNLPVENVSWYDAVVFCNMLSEQHGLKPCYSIDMSREDKNNTNRFDKLKYVVKVLGGNGFRLPTEAEWEYACRAGTASAFHYGNSLDSTMANFDGNYPYNAETGINREKTTAVGSFKPNAFGLYDMSGNVAEWCRDWYGVYPDGTIDPKSADRGRDRVLRGGCWVSFATDLRSAYRARGWPSDRNYCTGFRVVRSSF